MKKKISILIVLLLVMHMQAQWTWLYKKDFTQEQLRQNAHQNSTCFSKTMAQPVNQLIFSWNAFKPDHGYFSFYMQARDVKTKKWLSWHHMADWGASKAQSYTSKLGTGSTFHHVRLEIPDNKFADGVRVKIIAHNNANLSLIRSIAVNAANLNSFKIEQLTRTICALPSIKIGNIPLQSQMILDHPKADVMCSPTSCAMLTSYLMQKNVCPVEFAESAYDHGLQAYGSWPFNTAHAFERCRGSAFFRVVRLNSFVDLHKMLQARIPVVVSVRGKIEGAPKEYNKGHLLLVVGWDKNNKNV